MAVILTSVLEKGFVGNGIADGNDLFNVMNSLEWNRDTNTFRWIRRDANGDQQIETVDLTYLVNLAGSGGGGGGGGATNVAIWASSGDISTIPIGKLPRATSSARGIVELAVSGDADSDTSLAATPAYVTARLAAFSPSSGGGLTQGQILNLIRANVQDWAEVGNSDEIPESKLPDADPTTKGIIEVADENDADTGTNTLNAMTPALV